MTLQPAAGAHGELTGMLIIRAYMEKKGEIRHKIIELVDKSYPDTCSKNETVMTHRITGKGENLYLQQGKRKQSNSLPLMGGGEAAYVLS